MKMKNKLIIILGLLTLAGCATPPPQNPDNICEIFFENRDWYSASKNMKDTWGTPIHVPLAMMYQESSFKHNAAPPMQYFWFIPIGRASDAYGYAQAKTMTWDDYQRETENSWADRDDFADAIDFMGWFTNKTQKINGISKWDAYAQYLNYHEGWGGYKNKSYNKKPWLIKVSRKVDKRSKEYAAQLRGCQENLDSSWLWRLFFT
ncbi:transglycosylase SLT domain-containing protein [Psychromonas sp. Urea-02u-13]|uniref:transglycosylase SLT domain-containing protein n=1 Tax=Psychromonas sp. Urea-02u-13 TaxID=2058326 RepID=UPI000C32BAA8|nr:hypothetical protein [Psychromonas sp. Urea-02u-13]PKG39505.1 hypothetical protein CXF74_08045 [Psychromonas sp. Urea-02u-13]